MKKFALTFIMAATISISAIAEQKTVYMMTGGTGDGSTPETPVATFEDAFSHLDDDGGTIVICGPFTQAANYLPTKKHSGEVVITSKTADTDYSATANAAWNLTKGVRFHLGGPLRFKDIPINITATSNNFLLVVCNFNEFTMDEGVKASGFTFSAVANSIAIVGGCQDNLNYACGEDPKINIKGGEALIVGFNRGTAKNFTTPLSPGKASINISGGTIHNVFTGSVSSGLEGGDVDMNVTGGKFVGKIYGGKFGANVAGGPNQKLTISGGDFTDCGDIDYSKAHDTQTVTIDIKDAGEQEFGILMLISSAASVDNLVSNYKHPMKEFMEGETFTASNGITIPYQIRVPESWTEGTKLPLLTFLHGNGSRGDDNLLQITSGGSCALISYASYAEPSIIIAPQCPLKDAEDNVLMWIERDKYVGSDLYSTSNPQTPHLQAASELLDHIAAKYGADTDRLYLAGSSNGAGACWDMIVRNPGKFAAAVPVAGGREDKDLSAYGPALAKTAIWTFHGDADATLPVEGTRALVKAAKDAGATDDNLIYTEVPGADHNTIWGIAARTPGVAEWMFSKKRTNSESGIENLTDSAEAGMPMVIPFRGGLEIITSETMNVTVYTCAGVKVAETVCTGNCSMELPDGVYILTLNGTEIVRTHKIRI